MNLIDLVRRSPDPLPWAEGEKIPWNDEAFSARMLREHLSQEHDSASRRTPSIEAQVEWIDRHVLRGRGAAVLDLGCGPGLYSSRLARSGHRCVGIDFGPASIRHAQEQASREGLECVYRLEDVRTAPLGNGFDLAMMLYGEFNVFRPGEARSLLARARASLKPGGSLLLEAHTFDAVKAHGSAPPTWYAAGSGLFSERPHIVLTESFWCEVERVAICRHYVVDAETARVERCSESMQAYTGDGYLSLAAECGFAPVPLACEWPGADPGILVALLFRAV